MVVSSHKIPPCDTKPAQAVVTPLSTAGGGAHAAIPGWKVLLAGGISGAVSRTAVAPLERLKIIFQVHGMEKGAAARTENRIVPVLKRIYKEEGIIGYFRGNGSNVVRIIPYSAAQFYAYEFMKRLLLKPGERDLTTANKLVSGAIAGVASLLVSYPLDTIRARLSVQSGTTRKYTGILQAGRVIFVEEGMHGLFKGALTSVYGIAPYVALSFATYETIKEISPRNPQTNQPSYLTKFVAGAVAGTVAQTVTYPIDTARRRLQMQGFTRIDGTKAPTIYTGFVDAVRKILKAEGVHGLFAGLFVNWLKVMPTMAITFVVYEAVNELLGVKGAMGT